MRSANANPAVTELTSCDCGVSRPILRMASLNSRRSSAFLMASILAPISSTPYFSSTPASASSTERFRPVWPDDLFEIGQGQRFDVGLIGEVRIRHDGGRIGIDQDDLVAVGAQRLSRLRAGIIELAGLPDDDGAGADDQDAVEVVASRHAIWPRASAW